MVNLSTVAAEAGIRLASLAQLAGAAQAAGDKPRYPFGANPDRLAESPHLAWLTREFVGTAYWQYLAAFLCVLVGYFLKKVIDLIFNRLVVAATQRQGHEYNGRVIEALARPASMALMIFSLFVALQFLDLPEQPTNLRGFATNLLLVLAALDFMWLVFRLINVLGLYLAAQGGRTGSRVDQQFVPIISKSLKIFAVIVIFILILQNLGYSVGSLLAGLGIGGLAVAMASKDTLANFFGGMLILTDRPFRVGDLVRMADVEGTVEEIGFRSTKLRTPANTLAMIPNSKVVDGVIDNKSNLARRTVNLTLGVTCEARADELAALLADFRGIFKDLPEIVQDGVIVRFTAFGAGSFDVMLVYATQAADVKRHLEIVEQVNLELLRKVEGRGLRISIPGRAVYLTNEIKEALAGRKS